MQIKGIIAEEQDTSGMNTRNRGKVFEAQNQNDISGSDSWIRYRISLARQRSTRELLRAALQDRSSPKICSCPTLYR